MMDLPSGLRQAYEMGLVSSTQLVKYIAMNARPTTARFISRSLPQGLSRGFIGRHVASECSTKSLCWNCREPGHMAVNCPNEGICHTCGKTVHCAREYTAPLMSPGDMRLCNNCYKQGHVAADCTLDKACKNCRKTGHLARDCNNDSITVL